MEFFVAAELGMTVADLRARMSKYEFVRWSVFFARKAQRMEIGLAAR